MKTSLLLALAPLALAAAAQAASPPPTGVSESTDPAKAAAVEQHAQELAARGAHSTMTSSKSASKSSHASHKSAHHGSGQATTH
jgi:hypothetical protein